MERTLLIRIIKAMEPDYIDVLNFDDLSFAELEELYLKVLKEKRNICRPEL